MKLKSILKCLLISAIIIELLLIVFIARKTIKHRAKRITQTVSNCESLAVDTLINNPENTIPEFDLKKYEVLKKLGS